MNITRREALAAMGATALSTFPLGVERAFAKPQNKQIRQCPIGRLNDIFEPIKMNDGTIPESPLDFVDRFYDGSDCKAFVMPSHGCRAKPAKILTTNEIEYIEVADYTVGTSVDWYKDHVLVKKKSNGCITCFLPEEVDLTKYELVSPQEVLEDAYVEKIIRDQWNLILTTAFERNIVVYDCNASGMTMRLNSLMKTVMRMNGVSAPSYSTRRGRMTDLWIGDDIWNKWKFTAKMIEKAYTNDIVVDKKGRVTVLNGVNIHALKQLDANGEFIDYYLNELKGTLPSGKNRIVMGLDLSRHSQFVMPYWDYVIKPDDRLWQHKVASKYADEKERWGVYMFAKQGLAIMDSRYTLFGAI